MMWLVILAYLAVATFIYRLCIIHAAAERARAFNNRQFEGEYFYDESSRRQRRATLTWEDYKAGRRGYDSYQNRRFADKLTVAFRIKAVWYAVACLFWPVVGAALGVGFAVINVCRFLISKGSALTFQSWISAGEKKVMPKEEKPAEAEKPARSKDIQKIIDSDPDLREASRI